MNLQVRIKLAERTYYYEFLYKSTTYIITLDKELNIEHFDYIGELHDEIENLSGGELFELLEGVDNHE